MNKTLMITHTDLDGIGAIIVARLFSLRIDEYMFVNYDTVYDEDDKVILQINENYDRIIFTDFACTPELYEYLSSKCNTLSIFDHHERSIAIEDAPNVYIDMERSGTRIFYDVLNKMSGEESTILWDEFTELIQVYDLWLQDHPQREMAEDLNRLFYKILNYRENDNLYKKYEFFIESQIAKLLDKNVKSFYFDDFEKEKIESAKEKEYRELQSALKNLQIRTDSRGVHYGLYYGSSKISYVCTQILNRYENLTYVVNMNTFNGSRKKKINGKISVRSKKGFDVTQLQNVEGHIEAGGGHLPESFLKKMWIYRGVHLSYKKDVKEKKYE